MSSINSSVKKENTFLICHVCLGRPSKILVQILCSISAYYASADLKVTERIWYYHITYVHWNFHIVPCCHFQIFLFGFHTREWRNVEFWFIDNFYPSFIGIEVFSQNRMNKWIKTHAKWYPGGFALWSYIFKYASLDCCIPKCKDANASAAVTWWCYFTLPIQTSIGKGKTIYVPPVSCIVRLCVWKSVI